MMKTVYSYVKLERPCWCAARCPAARKRKFQRGLGYFLEYYRDHMLDATTYRGVTPGAHDELLANNA